MSGGTFGRWGSLCDFQEEATGGKVNQRDGTASEGFGRALDVKTVFDVIHIGSDFGVSVSISGTITVESFGLEGGGGTIEGLGF